MTSKSLTDLCIQEAEIKARALAFEDFMRGIFRRLALSRKAGL